MSCTLALAVLRLAVGEHPDVGRDARVVEHVQGQGDDGLEPVVLDDPAPDVALALARVAGEQRAAVVHLGDAAAQRGAVLHLAEHVGEEHHLAVARAGDQRVLRVARMLDDESGILDPALAAHALEVALPALAVWRVGEHEVKLARREGVVGEGGVLGPADDVVRRVALTLEQQVRGADGVGLGVDLLPEEVGGDLLAALLGELLQRLLGDGEHPAGAQGAVVQQVGSRLDLVGDGQEDQPGHELDRVAWGPVLAGLLVVLLVEAPYQLLEDRAHAVVVETGVLHRSVAVEHRARAEVDGRRQELLDQGPDGVGFGQPRDLVAELEALQDVLHVRREAVEVRLEVGLQLLLAGAGAQVSEGEPRGVVERLARRLPQRLVLVDDSRFVQRRLHVEHRLLGRLKHRVQAAEHGHGQDHIAVLSPNIEIPQDIIGDSPDEVYDLIVLGVIHDCTAPQQRSVWDIFSWYARGGRSTS
jgi:hypothetical protein